MRKSTKFSPEVRERAVRMVAEQRGEHESQWAAIVSIAGKIGATPHTLLNWVRQHERETGQREGVTMQDHRKDELANLLAGKFGLGTVEQSHAELLDILTRAGHADKASEYRGAESMVSFFRQANNETMAQLAQKNLDAVVARWREIPGLLPEAREAPPWLRAQIERRAAFGSRYDPVSLAVEHEALTRAKLKATARLDGRSHFVRFTNLDKDLAPKDEYELAAQQARTTQLRDALGLAEVGLIREFELCRFTHGYTRMSTDPLIEKTDRQTVRMPVRLRLFPSLGNKRRPIYVVTQANEALYFQLDAAMLMMWLEAVGVSDLPDWKQGNDESLGAHVLQRAEPFGKFFSDLHPDRPKTYRYVYTLLHSYSHMVMKAVADLSGLDLGSLGEYLFPADLAFVVYRNGTTMDLGNLSALWRNFNNSFLDHISAPRAMQCGSGSLCETKGGACPDCIVVPETSCVASNRLLSRSVMRSGLAPREDADHQGQPIPGFLDVVQRGADARVGG